MLNWNLTIYDYDEGIKMQMEECDPAPMKGVDGDLHTNQVNCKNKSDDKNSLALLINYKKLSNQINSYGQRFR